MKLILQNKKNGASSMATPQRQQQQSSQQQQQPNLFLSTPSILSTGSRNSRVATETNKNDNSWNNDNNDDDPILRYRKISNENDDLEDTTITTTTTDSSADASSSEMNDDDASSSSSSSSLPADILLLKQFPQQIMNESHRLVQLQRQHQQPMTTFAERIQYEIDVSKKSMELLNYNPVVSSNNSRTKQTSNIKDNNMSNSDSQLKHHLSPAVSPTTAASAPTTAVSASTSLSNPSSNVSAMTQSLATVINYTNPDDKAAVKNLPERANSSQQQLTTAKATAVRSADDDSAVRGDTVKNLAASSPASPVSNITLCSSSATPLSPSSFVKYQPPNSPLVQPQLQHPVATLALIEEDKAENSPSQKSTSTTLGLIEEEKAEITVHSPSHDGNHQNVPREPAASSLQTTATEEDNEHQLNATSPTTQLQKCLSATESDVASVDGLPVGLQAQWRTMGKSPRAQMLQNLDGISSNTLNAAGAESHDTAQDNKKKKKKKKKNKFAQQQQQKSSTPHSIKSPPMSPSSTTSSCTNLHTVATDHVTTAKVHLRQMQHQQQQHCSRSRSTSRRRNRFEQDSRNRNMHNYNMDGSSSCAGTSSTAETIYGPFVEACVTFSSMCNNGKTNDSALCGVGGNADGSTTNSSADNCTLAINQGDDDDDRMGGEGQAQWREGTSSRAADLSALAMLDCANIIHHNESRYPPVTPKAVVRVASQDPGCGGSGGFVGTVDVDPQMQDWVAGQISCRVERPCKDGSYKLGKSRTVIVHEINRGNWTWCTAWSPDGNCLAVATENHHLAIIDTMSSTVWRVLHDKLIKGNMKKNTTHSIRAIAWGRKFIAVGGTGNAVSILSPRDPYQVVHTIPGTGFVGSLDWRCGLKNTLAIGSRLDFVMIVSIKSVPTGFSSPPTSNHYQNGGNSGRNQRRIESEIIHTIKLKHWVNSCKFSIDGSNLAVGDAGGVVSVYKYSDMTNSSSQPYQESSSPQHCHQVETELVSYFKRKDSILSIEWSHDGKWLYAGGEDSSVTVIDTSYWEIVHRLGRERWVSCIAASHSGSHVAIGGVSSEISLLDVKNGWDSVMGIELKGLVPLSAAWHPSDQYLTVTGQDNSVLSVETTNARHVKGHHLHSLKPVVAIEFSPDGRMCVIANDAGITTCYSLSGTSFITAYELITPLSKKLCLEWSLDGTFIIIGAAHNITVVGRRRNKPQSKKSPPNTAGFSVKHVIPDLGETNAVSIDYQSHYVAISGFSTRILDVYAEFACIKEWKNGPYFANAWSPDGKWLAMIGKEKALTIYDTSDRRVDRWRAIFSMKCDFIGRSLAWGPLIVGGLLYLAYGGDSNDVYIMEIRTHEGTWETVLKIPRDGAINDLDWSADGLLAIAIGNGTVGIVDLSYLQTGVAVNEMDYNWQRQALTCFTEIRRNRGVNAMKSLRWLPAAPGSDRLLAVGGTDGEVEIIDLTERKRCRGWKKQK